jgi:hypothetical protein
VLFRSRLSSRQPLILYASSSHFQQTNVIGGRLGETTGGVTEGASGLDLAARVGITSATQTAIQGTLSALTEMRVAAQNIDSAPVRALVEQFASGQISVAQFRTELDAIGRGDQAVQAVSRTFSENAGKVDENVRKVEALQAQINALTGKTVDIVVRTRNVMVGAGELPEEAGSGVGASAAEAADFNSRANNRIAAAQRLARAQMSKEERALAELRDKFGNGVDDATLRGIVSAEGSKRGGGGGKKGERWTPEQRVFRELNDNAKLAQAGLNALGEETVKYARQARFAESETDAFIQALSSGNVDAAPEKLKRIYEQLKLIKEAGLTKELNFERDQIGRSDTEQKVASRLKSAGLPVDLDSAAAAQIRLNEQLSIGKTLALDFASSFANDLVQGKNLTEALTNALGRLAGKLAEMALSETVSALFAPRGGGGGGGFFGFLGSLLGIGGGAAPGPPMPLLGAVRAHSGGTVGISTESIALAPRFHSGGVVGSLGPKEHIAVLEYGERVLTKSQAGRVDSTIAGLASQTGPAGAADINIKIDLAGANGDAAIRAIAERASLQGVQIALAKMRSDLPAAIANIQKRS